MRYLVKKMENAPLLLIYFTHQIVLYFLTVQATCGLFSSTSCVSLLQRATPNIMWPWYSCSPKQTRAGESTGACVVFRYHSCLWTQHCQYNYYFSDFHFIFRFLALKKKKTTEAIPLSVSESKFTSHTHTDAHKSQKKKGRKQKKKKQLEKKASMIWLLSERLTVDEGWQRAGKDG